MIRHEVQLSTIRFYDQQTDDPFADYCAVATIIWTAPGVIWVKGFHGQLNRSLLREFLQFLLDNNIHTVRALRNDNRSIPGAVVGPDGVLIVDVKRLAARVHQVSPVGATPLGEELNT